MCGITGICNLEESSGISLDILKKMIGYMHHRGPDETGIYIDDHVGLGSARLSIIDLIGGTQPIHNENEDLWIVFNGEIYNFPELRTDLISKGHRFYTNTDTEVIIHLYEEKGTSCLNDLNGNFAFAIWNSRTHELFLARDRVGIRPLHYTVSKSKLYFASEIKSIFVSNSIRREIDPIAMDQIFTFWTTLPGRTVFKEIYEVPPGHYLKTVGGKITVTKYWEFPHYDKHEILDWNTDRICQNVSDIICDAVRIRLRADVPVATYLSGGLDSSGVTALMSRNFKHDVQSFGIRFEEKAFDESALQKQVAEHLNIKHEEITVSNKQIREYFPEVIWHCEKPILRTAPVPLFLLSSLVRKNNIKVVLTGEGADEVFGGYNIFREDKVRRFWARQQNSRFRFLLITKLYPYIFNNQKTGNLLKQFFGHGLSDTDNPLYSHLIRWNNTGRIKQFFSDDLKASIDSYNCFEEIRRILPGSFYTWDGLSKAQYLETILFMSNYLLSSQGDRVSMAHSVEIRLPYLDHRLIEFMAKVPAKHKIKGLNEKYILKKIFNGVLPENIVNRPKHPFRAPIDKSLLANTSDNTIPDIMIQNEELFNVKKIKNLLEKLQKNSDSSEVENMLLAGILSTNLVYNQFISGFP
ncbi:MAG: asparagine synthase (glutamine-hydrolyzing), partial [Candidatus Latescibacteria bacterium]|nr:asparagine synthase (glutamine-hydrolyzing) [Candidatus Latescibacterota bacterium]